MQSKNRLKKIGITTVIFFVFLNINILNIGVKGYSLQNCILEKDMINEIRIISPPPNGSYIEIYGGWMIHILLIARNGSTDLPWQYWVNCTCVFRQPTDKNEWRLHQYANGTGISLHMQSVLFMYAFGTFTVDATAGNVTASAHGTFFRTGRFLEWWFIQN
jgi:hypothetical protein